MGISEQRIYPIAMKITHPLKGLNRERNQTNDLSVSSPIRYQDAEPDSLKKKSRVPNHYRQTPSYWHAHW